MIPLKSFQSQVVENAVRMLEHPLNNIAKLKKSPNLDNHLRKRIIQESGVLLIEAPTGVGKTLMMGKIVEQLSNNHKIIWLWFAPFSGVIEQTIQTIKAELYNVTAKNIQTNRNPEALRTGDVFVTSWSSVAMSNADARLARKDSEEQPSLDTLIQLAKDRGYLIGTVIDEAHHSFKTNTQAYSLYSNVIDPDVTILATATPKDTDVSKFSEKMSLNNLQKISVSRHQGVTAGLIKKGIYLALFDAKESVKHFINYDKVALQHALKHHYYLKNILALNNIKITPLLLIQASSDENINEIQQWLLSFNIDPEQVRVHTSNEPDPNILTIANNEDVEFLIFKMAVATGFDAPRAFTLVSMRRNRDIDFGIQIVGRIMRVDRRLQALEQIPEELKYGYVFLTDENLQEGLAGAADKINSIKDSISSLTDITTINVIDLNESMIETTIAKNGQMSLSFAEAHSEIQKEENIFTPTYFREESLFVNIFGKHDHYPNQYPTISHNDEIRQIRSIENEIYSYPLRTDINFPKRLLSTQNKIDDQNLVRDVVNRFEIDSETLNITMKSSENILIKEMEIFSHEFKATKSIQAELLMKEIRKYAQASLFEFDRNGMIDKKSLQLSLEAKLEKVFQERGWIEMCEISKLRDALCKILVLKKENLKRAINEALKQNLEIFEAEELPNEITSLSPLIPSRLNIYGRYPNDLNQWELNFVKELDNDQSNIILWWHRNPPRKNYSVRIPIPDQFDYYPDFIVGVRDRKKGEGILLVEIKNQYNDPTGNAQAKAQVEHPVYKKPIMLYWKNSDEWFTIEYDSRTNANVLDRIFRLELMQSY